MIGWVEVGTPRSQSCSAVNRGPRDARFRLGRAEGRGAGLVASAGFALVVERTRRDDMLGKHVGARALRRTKMQPREPRDRDAVELFGKRIRDIESAQPGFDVGNGDMQGSRRKSRGGETEDRREEDRREDAQRHVRRLGHCSSNVQVPTDELALPACRQVREDQRPCPIWVYPPPKGDS